MGYGGLDDLYVERLKLAVAHVAVYILAIPAFSFFLPLYSFWKMDDFSWGSTRLGTLHPTLLIPSCAYQNSHERGRQEDCDPRQSGLRLLSNATDKL